MYRQLYGDQATYFDDEIHRRLRHSKAGCVSMASSRQNANGSQFFITVADEQTHLDDRYTIFGEVAEGLEVATEISNAYADGAGKGASVGRKIVGIEAFREGGAASGKHCGWWAAWRHVQRGEPERAKATHQELHGCHVPDL